MSLASELRALGVKDSQPLWKGPCNNSPMGGVTFSLLSRFLCCRKRFGIKVIDGIKPKPQFNHRMEYGNMWHLCEESVSSEKNHFGEYVGTTLLDDNLNAYIKELKDKYRFAHDEIDKWYNVCRVQFPIYQRFWEQRENRDEHESILQEQVFSVPYTLSSSGRTVWLRGKWDGVLLGKEPCEVCQGDGFTYTMTEEGTDKNTCIHCKGNGGKKGIYLKEHKTKSDIDEENIKRQLKFELQTMMYVVTIQECQVNGYLDGALSKYPPVNGVIYNVVRRPLSGGKHTIVRHKATTKKPEESKESYYNRLKGLIQEDSKYFFMRWNVSITQDDINRFKKETLEPILENLCDWWHQMSGHAQVIKGGYRTPMHWQHPFGVFNSIDELGHSELDRYIDTGDMTGLMITDTLFEELNEQVSI